MNERSAVEYRGRVFSLSGLAGELKGYKTGGFDLFRYNGVLLSDIQPE
jgi:hypothetical protein